MDTNVSEKNTGFVFRAEVARVTYRIFVGSSFGKRLLSRPRRRWDDNIEIDLREVVFGVVIRWSWLGIVAGAGSAIRELFIYGKT